MAIMNKASRKAQFYAALKALNEGPKTIENAHTQYNTDMTHVREMESRGIWAPVAIDRMKTQAQTKRDDTIRKAVDRMRDGLDVVRSERYNADALDVDDPSLQNSLRVIESMGRKLSPSVQLSILEKFRGNVSALNYLGDLYDRYGLFYGQTAREMTKAVDSQALDDMQYCLDSYEMFGEWPSDRLRWTGDEFNQALQRYGVTEIESPYVTALRNLKRNGETETVREAAAQALSGMFADGEESPTDDMLKAALDNCLAQMEAADG